MGRHQKRWILGFAVGLGLVAGILWMQPPSIRVSDRYSLTERREILALANRSARQSLIASLKQWRIRELGRWMFRNPWQTFHVVAEAGPNQVWLICGNPNAAESRGYVVWSQVLIRRTAGHWVLDNQ